MLERPGFAGVLQGLRTTPGVVQALVAAPDGLLIAGAAAEEEANELWAAVSAVLGKLGGQLMVSATGEALELAVFRARRYQFVVKPTKLGYVLAVAAPEAEVEGVCAQVEAAARSLEAAAGEMAGNSSERNAYV